MRSSPRARVTPGVLMAALAGVTAAAGVAAAQPAERTGAIVIASAQPAAGTVGLAAALAAGGVDDADVLVTAARARAAGAVPAAVLARFTAVGALVTEGWRAYLAADPTFAAARLAAARREAEALLALDGGLALYADVSLRLGVVLLHLGQGEQARDALRLAHALDPARPVTTAEFSPDAVAAHEAAIAAAPARVEIRIDALAGAEVEVDGAMIGAAPLVATVDAGEHVVVVRRAGYAPRGQAIAVTGRAPLVAIELEPDRGAAATAAVARATAAGELRDDDVARAVDDVLTYAEVDAVLLVASVVRAGAPALLGQRCRGGDACTAVVEVGYPDARGLPGAIALLRERLAGAEPRYGVILPSDARVTAAGGGIAGGGCRTAWCRRRWYLVGGGVAAAAIAAAVIVIAVSGDDAPIVTIDPDDFTR